jgi:hypothetical protein
MPAGQGRGARSIANQRGNLHHVSSREHKGFYRLSGAAASDNGSAAAEPSVPVAL